MKKAHAGKSEKTRIEKREPKNIRKKRTPKNGQIHLNRQKGEKAEKIRGKS